ncbi:MAG: hypothetical protein PHD04_00905 [Candidatus Pacebacteria bacterium]|nr:hypothetical protein [Candidatus Paceibacterota bacterium]
MSGKRKIVDNSKKAGIGKKKLAKQQNDLSKRLLDMISEGGGGGETEAPAKRINPLVGTKIQKGSSLDVQRELLRTEEELLRLEEEDAKLEEVEGRYRDSHRIEFLEPLPHQERFLEFIREGKKTVLIVGANQIGKTVICANMGGAFSLGCKAPWDGSGLFPSDFARNNGGRGVIGRIICQDWEKAARDTIVPKLKEWLPVGSYETHKNNVGVEHEFIFPKTGSKFTILTYKEDTKSHEGWTGDWVHADEPPPRDKYIANRRGLVARNGTFTMAMTAISEPWILDEIVLEPDISTGVVADIPISANRYLTEEAIRIFESSLSEDEKVARIQGGWLQLTGRVWKGFNPAVHVVDDFEIPPDWPVGFEIDFHLNTPHAVSFCAVDKYDRYFICEEIWDNCGSEELADACIKLKQKNSWRMKYGEIDALSKGDTSYIRNRYGVAEDSFTMIQKRLAKFQVRLGVGSKDEKSYIKAVETRLRGPNGMPTLFIFRSCVNTIKQVQRWAYDDDGKPKDDGHFPECIGRFTQSGLKYRPMNNDMPKESDNVSPLLFGLRRSPGEMRAVV